MKLHIELTKTEMAALRNLTKKIITDTASLNDDDIDSGKINFIIPSGKTKFGAGDVTIAKDKILTVDLNLKTTFVSAALKLYSGLISRILLSIKEFRELVEKYFY